MYSIKSPQGAPSTLLQRNCLLEVLYGIQMSCRCTLQTLNDLFLMCLVFFKYMHLHRLDIIYFFLFFFIMDKDS